MSTSIIRWLNHRTEGTWKKRRALDRRISKPELSIDTIKRLNVVSSLTPHLEVENYGLQWNKSGTILASTHKDGKITLWRPFNGTVKHLFDTGWRREELHSLNFIPSDEKLIAISPKNIVKVMNIENSSNILECDACLYLDECFHVNAISTHPNEPFIVWSSDSKCIRQYDIRERHNCRENDQQNVILRSREKPISALTMHPTRSEILALGSEVCTRLFDRRFPCNVTNDPCYTTVFAPGFLSEYSSTINDHFDVSNIEFNYDGSELLVSYWNFAQNFYMFRTFEPWEPFRSFEATLEPLFYSEPSEIPLRDANLKPYCQWNDLLNQKPIELPTEHKGFHDYITRKIRASENLTKGDYDKINQLLIDYKNCAELYLLRSDLLFLRDWEGDEYQALRDLCCAVSLKPSIRSYDSNLNDGLSSWRSNVTSVKYPIDLNYFDFVKRFYAQCEPEKLGFFGYQDEFIITNDSGCISIYDKATTNMLKSIKPESQLSGLSVHPSSCIVAASTRDGRILLMSLERELPDTNPCKPDYEYTNLTHMDDEYSWW